MALRLVIIVALIIAALGLGFVAFRAISPSTIPSRPQMALPRKRDVVVVIQPKESGAILMDADIRTDSIDTGTVPGNAVHVTSLRNGGLVGAMVRRPLLVGAVLRMDDILQSGRGGFLSAELSPGMRAISIGVDAITGAAGLVAPGDRVDLLLTQGSAGDQPTKQNIASENVLANLKVMAVDQRLTATVDSKDGPGLARTVTLEVTPAQALRVTVATQLGRLSLAVRPVEPPAPPFIDTGRPVYARDVSRSATPSLGNTSRHRRSLHAAGSSVTLIQGTDVQRIALP